jgi:hypothetical protein
MKRSDWLIALACTAGGAVALVVRAHGLHRGLIYPDGYQYLLMARGIAAHLTPTIQLGPRGELFVPSVDAALKPLFPALVALLSVLDGIRPAADTITAVAGAAVVVLAGLLAGRLTGNPAAAAVAAAAALLSPALAYWNGFVGPDALAEALALATALAVLGRKAVLTGLLAALCIATRPEWLLVLVPLAVMGVVKPTTRQLARVTSLTAAFALAGVIALLRPPLAAPPGGLVLLLGALGAGTAIALAVPWAARTRRRATLASAAVIAGFLAVGLSGRVAALDTLAREQWPLLALAAAGVLCASATGRNLPALILLFVAAVLGATYAYRNPGSERYMSQLLPLACAAAGMAATPLRPGASAAAKPTLGRSWLREALRIAAPAAAVVASAVIAPARAPLAPDTFTTLAAQLTHAPSGTLISAAPDAFGFLLPGRPQQTLRPGARGLILLDASQRAYQPTVTAHGVLLARLKAPQGFERADGTIDTGTAMLVRGVAVAETRTPAEVDFHWAHGGFGAGR